MTLHLADNSSDLEKIQHIRKEDSNVISILLKFWIT